jgi:hypothetical protein
VTCTLSAYIRAMIRAELLAIDLSDGSPATRGLLLPLLRPARS